jgi:hypothetical protein
MELTFCEWIKFLKIYKFNTPEFIELRKLYYLAYLG